MHSHTNFGIDRMLLRVRLGDFRDVLGFFDLR